MDLNDILRQRSVISPRLWKAQVALGIALIAFGTLVLVYPQILTYLISGLCVLLGLLLISFGLKIRRMTAPTPFAQTQSKPAPPKTEIYTRR